MSDFFKVWCTSTSQTYGTYRREILKESKARRSDVTSILNQVVQGHYVAPESIAQRIARLGYKKAAKRLNVYLPTTLQARSGDVGEIMATEYVNRRLPFEVPLFRLRWKDGRNMSLRGDDLVGISQTGSRLQLLKGEVKSYKHLTATVVSGALQQLRQNSGRPAAHTVNYIIDRLEGQGSTETKNVALLDGYLDAGISDKNLHHLLFTVSANDPTPIFDKALEKYKGKVRVMASGLVIEDHQDFIKTIFDKLKWLEKSNSKSE